MRIFLLALAAALPLIGALAPVSPAAASEPTMQERVDAVVAEYGGVQTGWNEVTWEDDIVLNLAAGAAATPARASAAAADNCAAGRYCVYSQVNFLGNKLSYSACPATYTSFAALLGSVRSVKNDLSGRKVSVYAGAALQSRLAVNEGATNLTGVTKVVCS